MAQWEGAWAGERGWGDKSFRGRERQLQVTVCQAGQEGRRKVGSKALGSLRLSFILGITKPCGLGRDLQEQRCTVGGSQDAEWRGRTERSS